MIRSAFRWLGRVGLVIAVICGAFFGYLGWLKYTGNFASVVDGQAYRSAQPTAEQIARYAKEKGIRSIVNLRGPSKGDWYQSEVATAEKLGIKHYDYRMSAQQILTQDRAEQLITVLKAAEKPVLIHCEWGADRSGLASALYVAAIANGGEDAAERQLSIRYGHLAVPLNKFYAMDETFERLEAWLGFPNS